MQNTKYAVTYGRADFHAQDLQTIFVATQNQVKDLAIRFINVIPDDLEGYIQAINTWDGIADLRFRHQDDDDFIFNASLVKPVTDKDLSTFNAFVTEFNAL